MVDAHPAVFCGRLTAEVVDQVGPGIDTGREVEADTSRGWVELASCVSCALWGLGFDLGLDTGSEDILGTGKYTAGPSALGVYMGPTFKGGALVQHYWDFAGDGDRNDVNMTNIQYLYYWSLGETTSIGAGPNILINWEQNSDNRYTVPVGIGINRTFQFGKVPVRIGIEYFQSVVTPDDVVGSDWSVRFYVIPAVPSAMFGWMQ